MREPQKESETETDEGPGISIREKCQILISFGHDPFIVEQKMGLPELEIRFLDCYKLLQRRQQIEASTLLSIVGSLFVKQGQENFFEAIEKGIRTINEMLGEVEDISPTSPIMTQDKMDQVTKDRERLFEALNKGKATRSKI